MKHKPPFVRKEQKTMMKTMEKRQEARKNQEKTVKRAFKTLYTYTELHKNT